jgi:hypothetical protein
VKYFEGAELCASLSDDSKVVAVCQVQRMASVKWEEDLTTRSGGMSVGAGGTVSFGRLVEAQPLSLPI